MFLYKKNYLLICFSFLFILKSFSQNCTQTNLNNKTFTICGNNCTNISFQIPNLKSSGDYKLRTIPYLPYAYVTPLGNVIPFLYTGDNIFSPLINIPFYFCFYDSIFNKVVISSNGLLTFDSSNTSSCSSVGVAFFPIPNASGVQCSGGIYYPKSSIMSVFTDLDPRNGFQEPSAPDRKIEYRTEGVAPCRKFIVSYYKIGTWGTWGEPGCWPNGQAIFQTVLYESTGIVEVYIENYTCNPSFAVYKTILGMQNWNRDKAIAAPGKNATTWTAVREAYQFIPSGGNSRFVSCGLYDFNGSFIANADTSSTGNGLLQCTFKNICPANDTTRYLVKTSFTACPGNAILNSTDTIKLVKNNTVPVSVTATSSCNNNGAITLSATGDNFTYSLNGGPAQTNPVFNNVAAGNHQVLVTGVNTGCVSVLNATVAQGNLIVQTIADTAICNSDSFQIRTLTNANQFNWQPVTGLNNPNIANPVAYPAQNTQYILTAQLGNCIKKDTLNINVLPQPMVNAGADISIVAGDNTALNGFTNAGAFTWTPATYLSSTSLLNPLVQQPANTILYKLTAINSNSCKAFDEVLVNVLPYCIAPKNAFTPNGDGINDLWLVYNSFSCLRNVAVQVYNRYGALVYQNKNYTNNWDGKYAGSNLPDATYYYTITYTFITGKVYTIKGDLTLLR